MHCHMTLGDRTQGTGAAQSDGGTTGVVKTLLGVLVQIRLDRPCLVGRWYLLLLLLLLGMWRIVRLLWLRHTVLLPIRLLHMAGWRTLTTHWVSEL